MKEYKAPEMTVYLFQAEDVLAPSLEAGEDETTPIIRNNFAD